MFLRYILLVRGQNEQLVHIEPLTGKAFSPFGTAISTPFPADSYSVPDNTDTVPKRYDVTTHPSTNLINQGTAIKIAPISAFVNSYPKTANSKPLMSLVSCFSHRDFLSSPRGKYRAEPYYQLTVLERHSYTPQTFVSLSNSPGALYLVIVAPSLQQHNTPPDLSNLRAFFASPDQAVTYAPGTWHAPIVVLPSEGVDSKLKPERIDFIVTQFIDGTERDCEEILVGKAMPRS